MSNRLDTLVTQLASDSLVRWERRGRLGLIYLLHRSPHPSRGNALTHEVRRSLLLGLRALQRDPNCSSILLLSDSTRVFSTGLNVDNFADGVTEHSSAEIPSLAQLTATVEQSPKAVIVFVQGLCASWGLELVLAAAYRIASVNCRMCFPEVQLSLVPCGGGSQRLVRLIGVHKALSMLCTGRVVLATEAKNIGLVDVIVEAHPGEGSECQEGLMKQVMQLCETCTATQRVWSSSAPHSQCYPRHSQAGYFLINTLHLAWMEHKIREVAPRDVRAPYLVLEAVRIAIHNVKDFEKGVAAERSLFHRCLKEEACKAMQYALRADNRTMMNWVCPTLQRSLPPGKEPASFPFKHAAVLGAGAVGSSLTFLLLQRGLRVTLAETDISRQQQVLGHFKAQLATEVRTQHRLSATAAEQMLSRLTVIESYSDPPFSTAIADADIVFECLPECIEAKKNALFHLDRVCADTCVFVSTTFSIDIGDLAAVIQHPGRLVGIQFYPPANVNPMVEVTRLEYTDISVLTRIFTFCEELGKHAILTRSCSGHAGTRLLLAALYQANAMLEDGCFPHEVDYVLRKGFNFQRGIFEVADMLGLDVLAMACVNLPPGTLPARSVFDVADELVATGLVGCKRGEGWYRYQKNAMHQPLARHSSGVAGKLHGIKLGKRSSVEALNIPSSCSGVTGGADNGTLPFTHTPMVSVSSWNPLAWHSAKLLPAGQWQTLLSAHCLRLVHNRAVEHRILKVSRRKEILRRDIGVTEIQDRILIAMINEAALLLKDGVFECSSDVDSLSIHAFGFPGWKGGLLYYADEVLGIETIVKKMNIYYRALGAEVFPEPCAALRDMCKQRITFAHQFGSKIRR